MLRNFIDTINVVDGRWGPPLVDEDWHRREEMEEKFNKEAKQGWTNFSRRSKNHWR